MSAQINRHHDDSVLTLTLEHEEKLNALTPEMIATLTDEFESVDQEQARVVVLTGSGDRSFCSGYDITRLTGDGRERGRNLKRLVRGIRECNCPTIARLNGDVIGAGYMLATACDLRIGVRDSRVGVPASKLGVVYTDTGIRQSIDVIGMADTMELLLTGELISASRADEMGFLTRLTDREDLDQTTDELASTLADNAPLAMTGMKNIIRAIADKRSLSAAENEWAMEMRAAAGESDDHREAKEAFEADTGSDAADE